MNKIIDAMIRMSDRVYLARKNQIMKTYHLTAFSGDRTGK